MWSKGHMPKDKNVIRRRLESTTLDITQSVPCSIHELENLIPNPFLSIKWTKVSK
jgi:hypothetical protein